MRKGSPAAPKRKPGRPPGRPRKVVEKPTGAAPLSVAAGHLEAASEHLGKAHEILKDAPQKLLGDVKRPAENAMDATRTAVENMAPLLGLLGASPTLACEPPHDVRVMGMDVARRDADLPFEAEPINRKAPLVLNEEKFFDKPPQETPSTPDPVPVESRPPSADATASARNPKSVPPPGTKCNDKKCGASPKNASVRLTCGACGRNFDRCDDHKVNIDRALGGHVAGHTPESLSKWSREEEKRKLAEETTDPAEPTNEEEEEEEEDEERAEPAIEDTTVADDDETTVDEDDDAEEEEEAEPTEDHAPRFRCKFPRYGEKCGELVPEREFVEHIAEIHKTRTPFAKAKLWFEPIAK